MAVLEGRAPARRPHHVVELAVVVMSRRRSSEIILHLGGLGAKKNNLSIIGTIAGVREWVYIAMYGCVWAHESTGVVCMVKRVCLYMCGCVRVCARV